MGRYSDSDHEDSSRRQKKKKKRRSRSRSRSVSSQDSRYSHSHSKHKKSKKKHRQRSRSRSRSSDRYGRRERTPPRRKRSRSRDRSHRSRSTERRRSRSHSRSRRSRSDSRGRVYSRRRSVSRDRGHRSRSRSHSRRSTPDRRKGKRSPSPSFTPSLSESNTMDSIPGFADMTPAEQAQARLKMALRAAAAADERLKDQSGSSPSPLSRQEFADAVANIESDAFAPSAFKSSRSSKTSSLKDGKDGGEMSSHHMAMFGAVGSSVIFTKTEPMDKHQTALEDNPETLFDSSLNVDPVEKMERWIQKLSAMRRKKLEGDIMGSK